MRNRNRERYGHSNKSLEVMWRRAFSYVDAKLGIPQPAPEKIKFQSHLSGPLAGLPVNVSCCYFGESVGPFDRFIDGLLAHSSVSSCEMYLLSPILQLFRIMTLFYYILQITKIIGTFKPSPLLIRAIYERMAPSLVLTATQKSNDCAKNE